jgi:formylglycine-generating enzyme required for sulfatase activity
MRIEELLLSATIEVGLGLVVRAGLEDVVQTLYAQLHHSSEHERLMIFRRAYQQAGEAYRRETASEVRLQRLLNYVPFQEEVVIGLLDPLGGCNLGKASRELNHTQGLQSFSDTLKNVLRNDPIWGKLLDAYRNLRCNEGILRMLERHNLPRDTRTVVHQVAIHAARMVEEGPEEGLTAGDSIHQLVNVTMEEFIFQQSVPPIETVVTDETGLRAYFRALAAECGQLPLDRIAGNFASKGTIALKDVYTDLGTIGLNADWRGDWEWYTLLIKSEPDAYWGEHWELDTLSQMVAWPGRKVLLGESGAGKTTLIDYLSYVLANAYARDQAAENLPENLQGLLPVRLVLRKAAAHIPVGGEGKAEMLWAALEEELRERLGAGYEPAWEDLRKEMRAGHSLVLLDGLDEVPEAGERRGSLLQAVEAFLKELPDTQRVLITARPGVYAHPEWQLQGFRAYNLMPPNARQVDRIVKRWYLGMCESVGLEEKDAYHRAEQFAAAIKERSYLANLALRPLLLVQMTLLHITCKELLDDRANLYEKMVDLLLALWQNGGTGLKIKIGNQTVELDPKLTRRVLAMLAYQAHYRQRGTGETEEPEPIPFGELLAGFVGHLPQILPADLNAYLENRTGLLMEREPGLYSFAHRSFQEYLAAGYLLDTSLELDADLRRLADEDPPWWREVILLAVGKTGQASLIAALDLLRNTFLPIELEECPHPGVHNYRAAILGGQALLELRVLERQPELAEDDNNVPRARRWLVGVMAKSSLPARERIEAGNVLAALGDPRFDANQCYLPGDELLGFVRIAPGPYPRPIPKAWEYERSHEMEMNEYYIQRYPVTVAQFKTFLEQSGYSRIAPDSLQGVSNHPVLAAGWYDALAYCKWLEEWLRENGPEELRSRLAAGWRIGMPNEIEWEKAARGIDGRIYPWGNEFDPDRANTSESGIGTTSPVGSFPGGASPYGVMDMAGNVWELTCSFYRDYPYDSENKRHENLVDYVQGIALQGGMFDYSCNHARSDTRWGYPHTYVEDYGFRVACYPIISMPT